MEVEFVHRNDLAVATTGGTSFDAKSWALGWLTKACDNLEEGKKLVMQIIYMGKRLKFNFLKANRKFWILDNTLDIKNYLGVKNNR